MKIGLRHRSTPGHGYYSISPKYFTEMPAVLKRPSAYYDGGNSFEEDCEWARICLAYPDADCWSDSDREQAARMFKDYHPDLYEEFTGEIIPPGESYLKDRNRYFETHKDEYLVISASGDWHEDCPKGFVLVTAQRGVTEDTYGRKGTDAKQFLVPSDEYSEYRGRGLPFVIDQTRHQEFRKE